MNVFAKFTSIKVDNKIHIFRHDTILQNGMDQGKVIALVYMLNPGSSRPVSDDLFLELQRKPTKCTELVPATDDATMRKVKSLVELAYQINSVQLPSSYSIHIENLFNLREEKNEFAKKAFKQWQPLQDDPMVIGRSLKSSYPLVWFAWGKTSIRHDRQTVLTKQFPTHIAVNKLRVKGVIQETAYPVHPLYMNTVFFSEAAKDKITPVI